MPRSRIGLAALIALPGFALLTLSGCVDTTLSYAAPGFSGEQLQVRGVAVGSLRTTEKQGPVSLSAHDAQMLRSELIRRLASSGRATRLTPVRGARQPYRLTVKLTRNDVDSWVGEDVTTTRETVYDDEGNACGCVTTTTYTTTANTRRTVAADFRLTDPATGTLAWAWSGEHADTRSRSDCSEFHYPPSPPLPSPPQTKSVADDLLRVAVRKLRQAGR